MAVSSIGTPDSPAVRYRCTACGNLTRFDVKESTTTRSFHHYTVGGELAVEDAEVLRHHIDEVSCRWCGTGTSVVEVRADGASVGDGPTGTDTSSEPPPEAAGT